MKLTMQFFCFSLVGFMGFLWSGKASNVNALSIVGYGRLPRLIFQPFLEGYPLQTSGARRLGVGSVLSIAGFAKIAKSVVAFDPVNVINHVGRPFSGHVEPSQPMLAVLFLKHFNFSVASFGNPSGTLPGSNLGATLSPRKNSRLGVIGNYVKKLCVSYHGNMVSQLPPQNKTKRD